MLSARDLVIWRSFPIFVAAGAQTLGELAAHSIQRRFAVGQTLFRKGDPGNYLLALTEGRVKLSILSAGGRELLIRIAEPGDLVGEIACLDGSERSTDATVMTEVDAIIVQRSDLREVASRHPDLYEAAIAHLAALLRATNDRLEGVALHTVEVRIARFLLITLYNLHGPDPGPWATFTPNLTQTDLGLTIGVTRSKENKALQDFRERRILVQDGTVWHCDLVQLRALVRISEILDRAFAKSRTAVSVIPGQRGGG